MRVPPCSTLLPCHHHFRGASVGAYGIRMLEVPHNRCIEPYLAVAEAAGITSEEKRLGIPPRMCGPSLRPLYKPEDTGAVILASPAWPGP
ncbi:hypothetical protein CHELA40_10822 [Chelatococcus asaccharovorans]|nr:hypothetical protein CHELA40_10822 [Chelatococcus asaccharovorans]CAH1685987.1 hypothetical protein CHELA17_64781 [Chelatococcus asaccharovorans]